MVTALILPGLAASASSIVFAVGVSEDVCLLGGGTATIVHEDDRAGGEQGLVRVRLGVYECDAAFGSGVALRGRSVPKLGMRTFVDAARHGYGRCHVGVERRHEHSS